MFDLVVNSTTSAFSPEQIENCGVQYADVFHASTPTNFVLFLHNSEELASEDASLVLKLYCTLWDSNPRTHI